MNEVIVVAKVKAKDEFKQEVYQHLTKLHGETHRKENGFLRYDFHRDLEDRDLYFFIETWKSREILEKHEQEQHFLDLLANVDGKLEIIEIYKLEKLL